MRRRYYKRTANRDKYSVEHTTIRSPEFDAWPATTTARQWAINILPPTDIEGMRKVKHLTLTFSNFGGVTEQYPIFYAVVYVPQGYDVNELYIPAIGQANNLYEPNQFVMSSGVLDFSGGPLRIRSKLSRNLNSGDRIALALATTLTSGGPILSEVTYAITLQ